MTLTVNTNSFGPAFGGGQPGGFGWFSAKIDPEVTMQLTVPVLPVPHMAPAAVVEQSPIDTAATTQVIEMPVRAVAPAQHARAFSTIVDNFRELMVARFITISLLGLNLCVIVMLGSSIGWTSKAIVLLAIASLLYGVGLSCSYADTSRRFPRLRRTIAVLITMWGLAFSFVGFFFGVGQFLYDFVHSAGLI